MKSSIVAIRLMAVMLLLAFNIKTVAAGGDKFTLETIKGSWGFSGDGVLAAPDLEDRLPIAGIGIVTFDGEGGCEISGTNNLNGTALPVASDFCTYTVNPDGTGMSEASIPANGPLPASIVPVSFVIVDGGQELRLMQTAVVVSHFVAKRLEGSRPRHRRR